MRRLLVVATLLLFSWPVVRAASGDTLLLFTAQAATIPATNGAQYDFIAGASTDNETIPVLDFDGGSADEFADFYAVLPQNYGAGGFTITVCWAGAATTGDVVWEIAFRAIEDDAEDLDTTAHTYVFNTVIATTASAVGELSCDNVTFTDGADADNTNAGDPFILRVGRDASDTGNDTLAGDASLLTVEIKET